MCFAFLVYKGHEMKLGSFCRERKVYSVPLFPYTIYLDTAFLDLTPKILSLVSISMFQVLYVVYELGSDTTQGFWRRVGNDWSRFLQFSQFYHGVFGTYISAGKKHFVWLVKHWLDEFSMPNRTFAPPWPALVAPTAMNMLRHMSQTILKHVHSV